MTRTERKGRMLAALLCCGLLLAPVTARADDGDPPPNAPATAASLRAALVYGDAPAAPPPASPVVAGRLRSIPLAFGMSAVVPGLGQVYNGHWIKAALAVVIESALAVGYVTWRNEGLEGERAYQDYAHAYWDPARYADWLEVYTDYLNTRYNAGIAPVDLAPPDVDFTNPGGWTAQQRQQVRLFFSEMRALEDELYHPSTGASFSHNLPYFGEQQYYELIGKYFQFAPGWEDYPLWNGNPDALDPEAVGPDGDKIYVRGRFLEYAEDHADANDLLRRASRVTALFVANHLVAAIDAAVFAKLHNDRLSTEVSVRLDPEGEPQPMASLKLRF